MQNPRDRRDPVVYSLGPKRKGERSGTRLQYPHVSPGVDQRDAEVGVWLAPLLKERMDTSTSSSSVERDADRLLFLRGDWAAATQSRQGNGGRDRQGGFRRANSLLVHLA